MQIPVKAAPGALVRHPLTRQPLPHVGGPEDPVLVDDNDMHWARLLRDGDVINTKPAKRRSFKKDDQA